MDDRIIAQAELQHLAAALAAVERGELEPPLFQKLRLQYGVYSMRRAPGAFMLRVRVPLGIVTPAQMEALAAACESFTPSGTCHLTTRQDIQGYGIAPQSLVPMLQALAAAGLTSREASGGVVRNVTCCPLAGVAPDEPFDVTPAARVVSDYLLRNPLAQLLPRKVKIAFEGCPVDHARTPIHDLGAVAAVQDGRPGFRLYVGGGLGAAPRAAQRLEPWTSLPMLLPTIEAILRLFDRFGERRIRAKARLKFLVEQFGWGAFQRGVLEERRAVWATQSGRSLAAWGGEAAADAPPPGEPLEPSPAFEGRGLARWCSTNVTAQRQAGFVAVTVRVPLGDLRADQLRTLAALARRSAGGLRLTNGQNLLLRFVPHGALAGVYEALAAAGLAEAGAGRVVDVTRCPGADTCLSAITRPRGLAEALESLCRDGLSASADTALSIKISGCPNSCGHHHIADIGLFGAAARVGDRYVPCYQLLVGGRTAEGEARFGRPLLRIPAQRAPEAVARIVRWYDTARRAGETFHAALERLGPAALEPLLAPLAELPAPPPAALCRDLGADAPFQLEARQGECAA
ncbi:MAG: nitrite/sulfite reductase [Candidatus Omnitrophica bacterium]|nr:nitrite/sulfite reductase [Candidatus Omnitrophota bacterium]